MKHKRYLIVIAVLGVILLIPAALLLLPREQEHLLETGAWGLSFRTEGETPVGNATKEQLAQYGAAFVGDESAPVLYLTFDCGYENGNTGKILDVLAAHDAPAAFFVVGSFARGQPELLRRMAEEGHIVGNHTDHHYDMSRIADPDVFAAELAAVEQAYEAAVGAPMPKYYRPPQGVYSEDNLQTAQKLGYHTVFWSLAYRDWVQDDQPSSEQAFAKLIPRIHNGAVVLLHSTSATNAAILDELLTRYEAMGYRFASLDELFAAAPSA